VLACAIEGMADYVVSDDRRDLLPLKVVRLAGHVPIQIVCGQW
jgi:predicted nucleic acid-binding protein